MGGRLSGRRGGRRGGRAWALGLLLLGCAASGPPARLLPDALPADAGIELAPAERRAALALGQAAQDIDAGRLVAAEGQLALANVGGELSAYLDFEALRLGAARGDCQAAGAGAARLLSGTPSPALAERLALLEGACQAALGQESAAQDAFEAGMSASDDPALRRSLGLALIESRQRQGDLEPGEPPEAFWDVVFPPDPASPRPGAEEDPGESALDRADAFVARGRSALAVDAYREALAGELDPDARRHAQLQLGVALFRLRAYSEALPAFAAMGEEPEFRLWFARSLARRGHVEEAIAAFEELAENAPPEVSIRARYLAAILLEDRSAPERAAAHYAVIAADSGFPKEALRALWRIGWSAWRAGDFLAARRHFEAMAERESDPLGALKPRYWAARAAGAIGLPRQARAGFRALARDWPLSYYGWRAQQRLGETRVAARGAPDPAPSTPPLDPARLREAALLVEAGYPESARWVLGPLVGVPCSLADCVRLGALLARLGDYHQAQRVVVGTYPGLLGQGLRPGYESLFWLSWPPAYAEVVRSRVSESGPVDAALVWAIMREESGFRPGVMSSAGAMGLLQLMPETARRTAARMGGPALEDSAMLFVPETNISLGSGYLEYLSERFPNHTSAVIASYNAGPNAVAKWRRGADGALDDDAWVEEIPYAQTRAYVRRVLRSLHAYRSFY